MILIEKTNLEDIDFLKSMDRVIPFFSFPNLYLPQFIITCVVFFKKNNNNMGYLTFLTHGAVGFRIFIFLELRFFFFESSEFTNMFNRCFATWFCFFSFWHANASRLVDNLESETLWLSIAVDPCFGPDGRSPTYLPTYLPTCIPTYLPKNLPTYLQKLP